MLFAFGCASKKATHNANTSIGQTTTTPSNKENPLAGCTDEGIVNVGTISGCEYSIFTNDSKTLIPSQMADGVQFTFRNGQRIKFGYQLLSEKSCSVGKNVKITCIMELPKTGKPHRDCIKVADTHTDWMKAIVDKGNVFEVVRYRYMDDGWAYYFKGMNNVLYDCAGNKICEAPGKILNDCVKQVNTLTEATVIYTKK